MNDNNSSIDTKSMEQQIARKMALRGIIASLIVFIFALIVFTVIKRLSSGNSDYMPIAQIKEGGEWTIVRDEFVFDYPDASIDQNATGVEFKYNEELDTYDLIIHYKSTK